MSILYDLETDGLLNELTTIHCAVFKDRETNTTTRCVGLQEIEAHLRTIPATKRLVAHNALGFDEIVLKRFFPWFDPGDSYDTLVASRAIWGDLKAKDFRYSQTHPEFPKNLTGSHGLKAWGHRMGLLKGDFSDTTDWKTFTPEMLEYCARDVDVLEKLYELQESKGYSPECLQLEHDFKRVIVQMEQRGVCLDQRAAVDLYGTLSAKRAEVREELKSLHPGWYTDTKTPDHWVAEDGRQFPTKGAGTKAKAKGLKQGPMKQKHTAFNPGSRDHIARVLMEKYNWEPKAYTTTGKPEINEVVLGALVYPEAKKLSEFFDIEKKIGQLAEGDQAWLKVVKPDGRIHGEVNTGGTATGRCAHSKPNLGQVNSSPEFRAVFKPQDGFVLVGVDAKGCQLRCLAHYMAAYDGGKYAKVILEGDVHTFNQQAAKLPTRDNAKTVIYALIFGAYDKKLGSIIGKGAAAGKKIRADLLASIPALGKVTKDTQRLGLSTGLVALDGRIIRPPSEHTCLNYLLQSAEAILVKWATVAFIREAWARGYTEEDFGLVLHVHDEFQVECRPEIAEELGKLGAESMTKAGEHYQFNCRIDGDYKVGKTWADTH